MPRAVARAVPWGQELGVAGVCLYVVGVALPFDWNLPLVLLASSGLVGTLGAVRRPSRFESSRLHLLVLAFVAAVGLSTLASGDMGRSLRLSAPLLPGILLFLLCAQQGRTRRHLQLLYLSMSVASAWLSASVIWAALRSSVTDPVTWVGTLNSPLLIVPNDIAWASVVAPLSLVVLLRDPRSLAAGLAAIALLGGVSAVVLLQSRVAALTLLVCMLGFGLVLRHRLVLPLVAVGFSVALLVDALMGFPLVSKFVDLRHWDGTGRLPVWVAAWSMFLDAPVLGHGPHTFGLYYRPYLEGLTFPQWVSVDPRLMPWPHNVYLEVLAEQGLVGFVLFGALLVCGASTAWRALRQDDQGSGTRLYAGGALAALVGLALAGLLELSLLRQWVVILLFVVLGVIARLSSGRVLED